MSLYVTGTLNGGSYSGFKMHHGRLISVQTVYKLNHSKMTFSYRNNECVNCLWQAQQAIQRRINRPFHNSFKITALKLSKRHGDNEFLLYTVNTKYAKKTFSMMNWMLGNASGNNTPLTYSVSNFENFNSSTKFTIEFKIFVTALR